MSAPCIECRLLILARFDFERWIEREIRVGSSRILNLNRCRLYIPLTTWILRVCIGIMIVPCIGPVEQDTIAIRGRTILFDTLIPLRVRNLFTSLPQEERALIEYNPHLDSVQSHPE
ncbi:hypothetical protein C451_05103 [Halococcus thailandensis JCM 13552]|uniref:Uncharacterized protein n=1 Tax=Halococcus thailandensis JCM 13552 TaxID=1227457 RepID=M0NDW2_9EURY|nr:hypothetical protein C451_05103 [Halococcus thailandensis JCM 13552]